MPFQNKVNLGNPPGWVGGFSSVNPRISVFSGGAFNERAFSAGLGGVKAGTFVWFNETNNTLDNQGTGEPDGFVANEYQGLITQYLEESSVLIPEGFMITAYDNGEFFIKAPANVSRKSLVYVDPTTGIVVDSSATNAVKTKFKYAKSGTSGDLIAISSWI